VLRATLARLEEQRGRGAGHGGAEHGDAESGDAELGDAEHTAAGVRFQLADLLGDRGDVAGAAAIVEPLTHRGDAAERREVTIAYVGLLNQAGNTDEALQRLRRLDPSDEQKPLVDALTVEVLLHAGREAEARQVIQRMVATGDPATALLAARAAQSQRRYDLSLPILEPLAAAADPSPDALFLLGAAYERSGRRSAAEETFERLIARVPSHHPALNYLGYMWAERGEHLDRALELVRRAVAAQPDQGSYLDSLAWVHYQLGDYELARKYLQRAAELLPGEAEVQEHLGDVQSALGDAPAARHAYRRALELAAGGNADMIAEVTRKLELLANP